MKVGYIIRSPTVESAYNQLIPLIFTNGEKVTSENGQETLELLDCTVIINNPLLHFNSKKEPVRIPVSYPFGKQYIQKYIQQIFYGTTTKFCYDYHSRLFNYRGDTNQIEYCIRKLQENINSRRAVAITWYPGLDTAVDEVPCLQFIQFLVRNGKLFMKVLFRSNDALLAFPANAYGLMRLGLYVAEQLGARFDKYSHTSVSMHIYYERDRSYIKQYFPECYKLIE